MSLSPIAKTYSSMNSFLFAKSEDEFFLGELFLEKGQYQDAVNSFEKVLELNPNKAQARKKLSEAYYLFANEKYYSGEVSQESWATIINLLNNSVQLNFNNAEAHKLLGLAYEDIGMEWERQNEDESKIFYFKKAYFEFNASFELSPDCNVAFYLARICMRLGEADKAESFLNIYLNGMPDNAKALMLKKEIQKMLNNKN